MCALVASLTRCFACPLRRLFALHRRVTLFALPRRAAAFLWFCGSPRRICVVLRFVRCIALSMVTELFSFGEFKINSTRLTCNFDFYIFLDINSQDNWKF